MLYKQINFQFSVHIARVEWFSFNGFLLVLHEIQFVSFSKDPRSYFRSKLSHGIRAEWILVIFKSIQSVLRCIFREIPDKIEWFLQDI